MPYKVSDSCGCPESKPHGIVKKDTGKRVGGCHKTHKEAVGQMQAMMASESMKMESSMKNPVILGVAATNRPHVRLREHPMSVVEINGQKVVRVPFMVKGKYRHPMGALDFTDEVFEKMVTNHKNKVGDFGEGLDVKHIPDLGSLAWFDPDSGGKIVVEDNLLVGYGIPTGEDALKFIENGKFKWASVEFHPDYKSTLEKKYLEQTIIDSTQLVLDEETIQLGNMNRDALGRWASKGGGAVKKVAGKVAGAHKEFRGGVKEAVKADLLDKRTKKGAEYHRAAKAETKSKSRKWGRTIGKVVGRGVAIGAGAVTGHAIGKVVSKLEHPITLSGDLAPTIARETLRTYVSKGGQEDYAWFDTGVFDWNELGLPIEDGHYKVDKQTAEEMLAVLDELAQEQPALFYTEEEMQTLEEALARIEELEGQLEELTANVEPEMSEREKAMAARIEALERAEAEKTVRLEIETARNYKDKDGRGHSAVVLNFLGDLMMGKPIGQDGSIKLESFTDPGAIAEYFRKGIAEFLKVAPGTQPVDSKTNPDDTRTLEATETDLYAAGKAAGGNFWGRN